MRILVFLLASGLYGQVSPPRLNVDVDGTRVGSQRTLNIVTSGTVAPNCVNSGGKINCALENVVTRKLAGGAVADCQNTALQWYVSHGATAYPAATCAADGFQAHLAFTAATTQTVYLRFELPSDWSGAMNLVTTGWATGTNQPIVLAYLACVSTGAMNNPTFGSAQTVSLIPAAASGRTRVSTALTVTGCAATNAVYLKLSILANTVNFNLTDLIVTE